MLHYNEDFSRRFWARVDRRGPDECWLWTGGRSLSIKGYPRGHVRVPPVVSGEPSPRTWLAHRVSYELSVGPIPPGLNIDHICHQTLCVNPRHLRPVTQSQNMQNRAGADVDSSSGVRGVCWSPRRRRWLVQAQLDRVVYYGGGFADLDQAREAAVALRLRLFTHNDADRV